MQVHLTLKSSNAKTGKIPVSTTSAESCPTACPFSGKNGCYAESGPLALHWRKVTEGKAGMDWEQFTAQISQLPNGQLWRHNQAGDLPGDKTDIDVPKVMALVAANQGKRGFTYTHYPMNDYANRWIVDYANQHGFTVNLSANDLQHADELAALAIAPVVVVLPSDQNANTVTPSGRKVIVCPATQKDDVTCETCGLCARANRPTIIGFPAHGTHKAKASARAKIIPIKVAA